jgi:acetylornithine aminotransferase
VLEVIKDEKLIENAAQIGQFLKNELKKLNYIKDVRGRGLMIGIEMDNAAEFRKKLIYEKHIFTGFSGPNTIRLLPPLNITIAEARNFIEILKSF